MARTRTRAPLVMRSTLLSGAPIPDPPPIVVKAVTAAKPFGGLVVGAVVGAVAAYFVPKYLDRYFSADHSPEIDLEYDD